jgi:zinc and cadmium transporter
MNGLPGLIVTAILASHGAVLLAAAVLKLPERTRRVIIPAAVAFAAGTMLAAVFLGLLPHALSCAPTPQIMAWMLGGIFGFFVLERLLLWRHCHDMQCSFHRQTAELILIGDGLHNFIDGIVLAVAWSTSPGLGMATTVAIIAHEIPQEIGDFAILVDAGWSPRRAFLWNQLSAATTLLGALGGWWLLATLAPALPPMMAVAAAGFLYVAVADILPGLHQRGHGLAGWLQLPLILAGIGTIALCHGLGGS